MGLFGLEVELEDGHLDELRDLVTWILEEMAYDIMLAVD